MHWNYVFECFSTFKIQPQKIQPQKIQAQKIQPQKIQPQKFNLKKFNLKKFNCNIRGSKEEQSIPDSRSGDEL